MQCDATQGDIRIDSSFTSVLHQSNLRVGKWHVRVLNKPQVLVCLACRKTIFVLLLIYSIYVACKMLLIPQI